MAIGFADLVGFSSLSEQVELRESSRLARKLEEFATAVAQPPVRLVKLIGDEAMLVCEEVKPLVAALIELKDKAEVEQDFPSLHLGVAVGEVVPRAGDVYGPAVNQASRLTSASKDGQFLIAPEAAESLDGTFEVRELDPIELKGLGRVKPVEVLSERGS
jgi:adenylate cyclase